MLPILTPTDFVALLNQTLDIAYPSVEIEGEIANFRISKNRWVYFDLKDEISSVKFFGTVYALPGPLDSGMMVRVRGLPRLHNNYGFSVNIQSITPVGEGSIKKAANLLEAKLAEEGLFAPERKRLLPYPPKKVGLITSGESAAYHDFVKILKSRWVGVDVILADTQVQGEIAPGQILRALDYFNTKEDLDVIVITRGGGSMEDLATFSTEQVTRAVAASRTPTLVAIGHEVDVSLAELAADQRASTPSNAAELLVPDKRAELVGLAAAQKELLETIRKYMKDQKLSLQTSVVHMNEHFIQLFKNYAQNIRYKKQILEAFNPSVALKRGYAVIRSNSNIVKSVGSLKPNQIIQIELKDGSAEANITSISVKGKV